MSMFRFSCYLILCCSVFMLLILVDCCFLSVLCCCVFPADSSLLFQRPQDIFELKQEIGSGSFGAVYKR